VSTIRIWATACAVLILGACEKLPEASQQEAPSSQALPSGAAGVASPRSADSKQTMPRGAGTSGGGESVAMPKGSANGAKPSDADAGANARNGDAKASAPSASMPDASVAATRSPAAGGAVPMMKGGMSAMDAGAAEALDAGASAAMAEPQPEAAGAEAMAPLAGAAGSQTPIAGSESMMPPECTPVFPGATCATAPQCGCEQGENCAYLSLDFPACLRAGSAGLNQRCSLATDCQIGLQCVEGACLKLCDPERQECGDEVACNQNFSSLNRPIPGYFTCSSNCNLVDPQRATDTLAACGGGLTCVVFGQGTDCLGSGPTELRHGEPCEVSSECAPGYGCADSGTCARWCEVDRDCPSGYQCADLDVDVLGTRFGMCHPTCGNSREVACEVNGQCGCEGTMACDFFEQDGRFIHGCRPTGRAALYARCELNEDCGAGASCISGRCAPFCERDAECGGSYATCSQVHDGDLSSMPPIPGYLVCRRPCDPADLTRPHGPYQSCPEGSACAASTDGLSYCRDANEEGVWGTACSASSDCAVGHECSSNLGCAPQCRSSADCNSGYTCAAFDPAVFADVQEWGICVPVEPSAP
jgi:hypothetical protein